MTSATRLACAIAALALSAPAAAARDQIRIVGSSTVFPYTQAVAEEFANRTRSAAPIVEVTGTGGAAPSPGDDLTAVALTAVATAEAETDGTAYEIDDQDDDGTWEVDVRVDDRSVEVTVAADGTAVESTEDDDLDDDDRAALDAATITLAEAVELAVAEVGGVLDDAELEEEDGSFFWEVTLDGTESGDDVEVKVSVTGEILQTER